MEKEKIFANDATDKSLISKIYKQLIQLNAKKKKKKNQKVEKRPKQTFLQRRHIEGEEPRWRKSRTGKTFSPTNSSKEHLNVE